MTAAVQRTQLHFFFPFTSQGESYRLDSVLSPIMAKLDAKRADKRVAKDGCKEYLQDMVLAQESKVLTV